jgi:hypothetical protein
MDSQTPQASESLVMLKADTPIALGNNQYAPLADLLAHRDPHCKYCSEGWQRRNEHGRTKAYVCGCCKERYRKAKAAEARAKAEEETIGIAPIPSPEERQRRERMIEQASATHARLEGELAERKAEFERSTANLDEAAKRHAAKVQDGNSEVTRRTSYVQQFEQAVVDAERRLTDSKAALERERTSLQSASDALDLSKAMFEDVRAEKCRRQVDFEHGTRRLRRDIARAREKLKRLGVTLPAAPQAAPEAEVTT